MIKCNIRPIMAALMFLLGGLAACSDSSQGNSGSSAQSFENGILQYVAADTPYLFATPGDLPEDVFKKLEPQLNNVLHLYHELMLAFMDSAEEQSATDEGDPENIENLSAILDELGTLMSIKGLGDAGINYESDFAIYGVGLLPVLRLSLSDGDLFEAALVRLEEKAEAEMSVASIDSYDYRYVGDEEGRLIIAIIDDQLVVTAVPTELSDDLLKSVLGITLPAENIVDSGLVKKLADKHGFTDYLIGFMDTQRMIAPFLDEPTGMNAVLVPMMTEDAPQLSAVCKAEIRSMAGVAPMMVMGYTEISTQKISSKFVIELRDDIAAGVAAMVGSVPGLGAEQGGLLSFGFSMDLLAARGFYSSQIDAIEADPYECELFGDMDVSIAAAREMLNQPVPPIVYGFSGFLMVIEDMHGMDIANGIPPSSIDMRMLVATDNAEGLLAMGSMFSPEIAALQIELNGEPVKLDLPQIAAATTDDVFIAISDTGIALSSGDGTESKLTAMLSADVGDPSPFATFEVDAESYYGFISEAMDVAEDDELEAEEDFMVSAKIEALLQEINLSMGKLFERIYFDTYFTEAGIEFESTVTLVD